MRAVIRDIQDYVADNRQAFGNDAVPAPALDAYLLACLITAGGYDDTWDYASGEG